MTLRDVLVLGSSERQPPLALDFISTKNHARTGTVPLDGGNLDVVHARDQSSSLGIAGDRVKGLAGRIEDHRVENIGGT
jgi:hypothetical protein